MLIYLLIVILRLPLTLYETTVTPHTGIHGKTSRENNLLLIDQTILMCEDGNLRLRSAPSNTTVYELKTNDTTPRLHQNCRNGYIDQTQI